MIFFIFSFLISLLSYFLYLNILSIPPFFLSCSRFCCLLSFPSSTADRRPCNILKFTVFCVVTPCSLVQNTICMWVDVSPLRFYPEAGVPVTLGTYFRNLVGWNPRSHTSGSEVFRGLVQFLQTNASIKPFQIHSSSLFMNDPTVWFYIFFDTESVPK